MKLVKAVAPYIHPEYLNFKTAAYEAWVRNGGQVAEAHYPVRLLHGPVFRHELPTVWKSRKEVRLRFVEPNSIYFDTFPDYAFYEVIPMVWDCWPCYFEKMCAWLKKHEVKTAIFTSSQTVERIRQRFPKMNVMWCPEAVDVTKYDKGEELGNRIIDFLEYGRNIDSVVKYDFKGLDVLRGQKNGKNLLSQVQLLKAFKDSKIVAAFPKSETNPEEAGGIETLTQRYWECMLSRMVLIGHAPKELVDLMGYNPVIELDREHPNEQLRNIVSNIEAYQPLVDRNREEALKKADWKLRMGEIMGKLQSLGYEI